MATAGDALAQSILQAATALSASDTAAATVPVAATPTPESAGTKTRNPAFWARHVASVAATPSTKSDAEYNLEQAYVKALRDFNKTTTTSTPVDEQRQRVSNSTDSDAFDRWVSAGDSRPVAKTSAMMRAAAGTSTSTSTPLGHSDDLEQWMMEQERKIQAKKRQENQQTQALAAGTTIDEATDSDFETWLNDTEDVGTSAEPLGSWTDVLKGKQSWRDYQQERKDKQLVAAEKKAAKAQAELEFKQKKAEIRAAAAAKKVKSPAVPEMTESALFQATHALAAHIVEQASGPAQAMLAVDAVPAPASAASGHGYSADIAVARALARCRQQLPADALSVLKADASLQGSAKPTVAQTAILHNYARLVHEASAIGDTFALANVQGDALYEAIQAAAPATMNRMALAVALGNVWHTMHVHSTNGQVQDARARLNTFYAGALHDSTKMNMQQLVRTYFE